MNNPFRLIGRFGRDKRGNVAVTFVLALLPIMSAIGCAIDYSLAARMKVKLQSAADAASVASLSKKSPGFIAAAAMTTDGSVTAAVTDAQNVFDGDVNGIPGHADYNITRTATVTKTGVRLASNVTFSAVVPTLFMRVMGASYQSITVTGSSSSSSSLPAYLDFYITLDVSSSMGLPSTAAEAVRMQNVNPDNYRQYPTGCTLACHFAARNSACTDGGTQGYPTNGYCMGYIISRVSQAGYGSLLFTNNSNPKLVQLPNNIVTGLPNSLYAAKNSGPVSGLTGGGLTAVTSCNTAGTDSCIQLRLDAVGYALNDPTNGLFALAQSKAVVTNQFRIGLYPFIQTLNANYAPLTSTINASSSTPGTINYAAANLASLLDTNTDPNLGSGGTHIDTALITMNTLIATAGDGSSSTNTQPYVFLVTDGAQDPQTKGVPNGSWAGSNHATTIDNQGALAASAMTMCTNLKTKGVIVSILYIPYVTINPVNTTFAGNEDTAANTNIQYIPASLQKCASPPDAAGSYFYTANSPQEIQDSLKAMFNHALVTAHLTN
jgi:Flp pilus assembly protein TadG